MSRIRESASGHGQGHQSARRVSIRVEHEPEDTTHLQVRQSRRAGHMQTTRSRLASNSNDVGGGLTLGAGWWRRRHESGRPGRHLARRDQHRHPGPLHQQHAVRQPYAFGAGPGLLRALGGHRHRQGQPGGDGHREGEAGA